MDALKRGRDLTRVNTGHMLLLLSTMLGDLLLEKKTLRGKNFATDFVSEEVFRV